MGINLFAVNSKLIIPELYDIVQELFAPANDILSYKLLDALIQGRGPQQILESGMNFYPIQS